MAKTPGKTPRKSPRKTAAKPVTDLPADPANTEAKAAKGPAKASPVKPQTPNTQAAPTDAPKSAPGSKPGPKASATSAADKNAGQTFTSAAPKTGDAPRRGGIMMPLLGGVLAAAIGAAAVLYLLPQGWNGNSDEVAAQSARITALQGGLDALRAEIPGDRAATIAALQDEVAALATSVAQLDARVATAGGELDEKVGALRDNLALVQETQNTLTGRVGALEARPVDQAPDIAALQADVRALTERLETAAQDARDQISAANERAAEVEKLAVDSVANQATQSTLTALGDAVASGRAYDSALGAFQAAAPDAVIVPSLADNAANGVASLRALRADFPDAARAVLADVATAAAENATMTDRMFAFFRAQTGARSLSPREGDDADAVLSRAEAALGDGDLAEAVLELRALPPEVADPMQGWLLRAQTRLDVMSALNDLSAPKTSN